MCIPEGRWKSSSWLTWPKRVEERDCWQVSGWWMDLHLWKTWLRNQVIFNEKKKLRMKTGLNKQRKNWEKNIKNSLWNDFFVVIFVLLVLVVGHDRGGDGGKGSQYGEFHFLGIDLICELEVCLNKWLELACVAHVRTSKSRLMLSAAMARLF